MSMAENLPTRVARVGGAVKQFDEPRLAYKSVATESSGHVVATLLVPPQTRVVYPAKPAHAWNSNKLRAERATVLNIDSPESLAVGPHSRSFVYEVGDTVQAETFNSDPHNAAGGGLYCFATRAGAEHWGDERNARPWEP
jgi:hypothetical protein